MEEGKSIAFASDAGTPGISDPGAVLVSEVRKAGFNVVPIPGASAFATLVSVAGTGGKTIIFEGFLSPKSGRRKNRVKELLLTGSAFVLYESPFRIVKLLNDIADIDSDRRVVVGRELTKLHEEIVEDEADVELVEEVVTEEVEQLPESYYREEYAKAAFALNELLD
jgi:16S rRNA (cytidine1402-2'-O)-methyltransferase